MLSKDSRSRVNPALHVGEQISGGTGWCAWIGSGGRATGGEPLHAQPETVSSTASSISVRHKVLTG